MNESEFIKHNTETWLKLEGYAVRINKKGIKSLNSSEIKEFLYVFRQSSHHLAYVRTYYPKSRLGEYLNSIIINSHSYVYGVKKVSLRGIKKYLGYEFPRLLREHRYYILASFGFFAIGFLISMLLVFYKEANSSMFLEQSLIDGIKSRVAGGKEWDYPLMSSYIMINNITVSLKAFALGITLGFGTIYVLFFNGATLGALTALIYSYGKPLNYWSLILPHGVTELTAVFISGAAGLTIAKSLLIPGKYTRKHALIASAKASVPMLMGVMLMLVIAGIIEGFFTPLNIPEGAKLTLALVTAILWAAYFSIPYVHAVVKNNYDS